jgi:hypothetical protein
MAEIVAGRILARASERHRAGMSAGETGKNPEQGGLARPVRAAKFEHAASPKTQREAFEQHAQSTRSREVFDLHDER